MFGHERDKFVARSVVSKFAWLLLLKGDHRLKKYFAPTTPLDFAVDIEIKNAKWLHLN